MPAREGAWCMHGTASMMRRDPFRPQRRGGRRSVQGALTIIDPCPLRCVKRTMTHHWSHGCDDMPGTSLVAHKDHGIRMTHHLHHWSHKEGVEGGCGLTDGDNMHDTSSASQRRCGRCYRRRSVQCALTIIESLPLVSPPKKTLGPVKKIPWALPGAKKNGKRRIPVFLYAEAKLYARAAR